MGHKKIDLKLPAKNCLELLNRFIIEIVDITCRKNLRES